MDEQEQSGLIDYSDMSFDFEEYFQRYNDGELSDVERAEFDIRLAGFFTKEVLHNRPPPDWVCLFIAKKFYNALSGDELSNAFRFPPPWTPWRDTRPKAEIKRLDLYLAVARQMETQPDIGVTAAIQAAADEKCVSFQTARAAYYEAAKLCGSPAENLKNRSQN